MIAPLASVAIAFARSSEPPLKRITCSDCAKALPVVNHKAVANNALSLKLSAPGRFALVRRYGLSYSSLGCENARRKPGAERNHSGDSPAHWQPRVLPHSR